MSRAYYNENDPAAAAWLRNLIARDLIAPGDVDDRSIADVQPADLVGYAQCHFFAGIGGWSYALRIAGWPDERPVWTGSCPCQPFSSAGKGEGYADERHLWPHWHRLISECRPQVVFGEQVNAAIGLGWYDDVAADLEELGYELAAADFPAASVGAPHIRQRLYFVADLQQVSRGEANGDVSPRKTWQRRPALLLQGLRQQKTSGIPEVQTADLFGDCKDQTVRMLSAIVPPDKLEKVR